MTVVLNTKLISMCRMKLRNKVSKEKFGKNFADLDEEQQKAVQQIYPQKISEAEPKNYGGKK